MQGTLSRFNSEEFEFRYLEKNDYNKGMFEVLAELTKAPKPTYESY